MGQSRAHRQSYDTEYGVHCLTFSTFQRRPFFSGKYAAGWFVEALAEARVRCPFHLFAYVVMPEHVHVVLQPEIGVKIRTVLWRLKRPVTTRVVAWVTEHSPDFLGRMTDVQPSGKSSYRFWQRGGGYDRNLRRASDVHEKIAYIHNNPVRRGLVSEAEQWRHSSAADWILGHPGPVPIDWGHLPEPELR